MKRCWFGGGILVLLLAVGIFTGLYTGKFHQALSEDMIRAAALAGEDREKAQEAAEKVREKWERRAFVTAVLSDHAPMEAIEENFALLTPEAEEEDFRETCLRLSAQLKALGEAQMLSWENLF